MDDWCELDRDDARELDRDDARELDPALRCGALDGAAACVGALLCGCDLDGAAACVGALLCGCDLAGALCDEGRPSRLRADVWTSRRGLLAVPDLLWPLLDLANAAR